MIDFTQPALALAEGFGLALSPCILPILPLILASGATGGAWRPLQIVIGFILSFTAFSLISRQILLATGIQQDSIQFGAFVLLLIFGVIMLVPRLEEKFSSLTSSLAGRAGAASSGRLASQAGGGFLVGALIGLVWTPCAGPILAVALLQVIQSQTSLDAVLTIAAFSIGAGLPMLAIGYSGKALIKYVRALSRHTVAIRRAMGVVIVIFATMGLLGFNIGAWLAGGGGETEAALLDSDRLHDGLAQPYQAPEIAGIAGWLNSKPLTLQSLKGKVVLIDFWTYSCINCIRTLPHITQWYETYKKDGLVVIGVHSPEFAFEGQRANIQKALKKFGITYPVAMDNDFATWNNFKNSYWPAHYLIDREGRVVYTHFGEGHYGVTESNIRYLLGLRGDHKAAAVQSVTAPDQTPETYLGNDRAKTEASAIDPQTVPLHRWSVKGRWKRTGQYIESAAKGDALYLHYRAKKVFLVMESADKKPKRLRITRGGKTLTIKIDESKLYDIVVDEKSAEDRVVLEALDPGLRLFAFTFES